MDTARPLHHPLPHRTRHKNHRTGARGCPTILFAHTFPRGAGRGGGVATTPDICCRRPTHRPMLAPLQFVLCMHITFPIESFYFFTAAHPGSCLLVGVFVCVFLFCCRCLSSSSSSLLSSYSVVFSLWRCLDRRLTHGVSHRQRRASPSCPARSRSG